MIVVADDDAALRSLFRTVLDAEGYEVLVASDGQRALDLARGFPVELMLLDLHMPGLDGFSTLRDLRQDPTFRTLPIIVATGSSQEADRIRGLDLGADDVIVKPVSIAELVARVRRQIRGHAAMADQAGAVREHRRRLATLLSELPRDVDLQALGMALVDRLPAAVAVDGVAILVFDRTVAASRGLRTAFPPGGLLEAQLSEDLARRSTEGPWLQADPPGDAGIQELAYVPFRLSTAAPPVGYLVYGRSKADGARLAGRLGQLIDITEFVVSSMRPAIEHAATTDAAIMAIRGLITERRFATHLQPISVLTTGEVFGYEALTRFDHGVAPDVQFAEAARLGLGSALERAALTSAIEAMASLPSTLAVSLNVSPDVLEHEPALREIVGSAGRPVIIELTEHERIDDYAAIRAGFERLGPGVRLAVDDAGSGYASLKHILSLQPSFVKMDIEWVRGIDRDPVRRSLVSGLVYFAETTGSDLIAEGIETQAELDTLIELGVHLGQGYLIGRPVPPAILAPDG